MALVHLFPCVAFPFEAERLEQSRDKLLQLLHLDEIGGELVVLRPVSHKELELVLGQVHRAHRAELG